MNYLMDEMDESEKQRIARSQFQSIFLESAANVQQVTRTNDK